MGQEKRELDLREQSGVEISQFAMTHYESRSLDSSYEKEWPFKHQWHINHQWSFFYPFFLT